jgi:hypothetical protein
VDPVSVIETALAAGAAAGIADVATSAARDTYAALRHLVRRRLADVTGAHQVLAGHEVEPGRWRAELVHVLDGAGAGHDEEILGLARRLLAATDPAGTAAGKYAVDLRQARGVQVGDQNVQHNTFTDGAGN